jgi:hypothetical protein
LLHHRNHLDFRGRLDGEGTRYGKILDFRCTIFLCTLATVYCTVSLKPIAATQPALSDSTWKLQRGKPLTCRLSELRIIELLENLSSDLDSFKQVEVEGGIIRWQHLDHVSGNVTTAPDVEKQHWKRQLKRCNF